MTCHNTTTLTKWQSIFKVFLKDISLLDKLFSIAFITYSILPKNDFNHQLSLGNHIISILLRKQKFKLRLSVNNYIPVLMYKFNTSRTYTGMVQWIFLSSFRSTNPANIDWERKTWRLKPWRFKQVDENATGERKEIAFIFQQKWNVWISFHKCQTRNKLAHDRELCNFKERR